MILSPPQPEYMGLGINVCKDDVTMQCIQWMQMVHFTLISNNPLTGFLPPILSAFSFDSWQVLFSSGKGFCTGGLWFLCMLAGVMMPLGAVVMT